MRALRLLALCNLAVAQPIYDVLRRSPEFFIAHGADEMAILTLVFGLSFLLAGLCFGLEFLAGLASRNSGERLHRFLCALLFGVGLLPMLKRAELAGTATIALAAAFGLLFALACHRFAALRKVLSVAAVAAVVVPGVFLLQLRAADIPPSPLSLSAPADLRLSPDIASPPIVLILFDQLPTAALIDRAGQIDARRHPNFARLAAQSRWFRNATTVAQDTVTAVPAILTGRFPTGKRSPVASQYPQNLFSSLASTYWLNASELLTRLAPQPRDEESPDRSGPILPMLRDVGIVGLHIFLPNAALAGVPSIDQQVAHFGTPLLDAGMPRASYGPAKRLQQVDDFLASMQRSAAPGSGRRGTLHFLHVNLPHVPYLYDPSGREYARKWRLPGLAQGWGDWSTDPEAATLGRQRFLLQVLLADRLLGEVIDAAEAAGIYEDALFIVTSDHGASFRAGHHARAITPATYRDILYVPLFIKRPGQKTATRDDRNAQVIDIAPTIAALAERPFSWPVDGQPLLDPEQSLPETKRALVSVDESLRLEDFPAQGGGEFAKLTDYMADLRFDSDANWIHLQSPWDALLGTEIAALEGAPQLAIELYDAGSGRDYGFERAAGWIQGQIRAPADQNAQQWPIAIGIDGVIVGIARSFRDGETSHYFSLLLPRETLGGNDAKIDARIISAAPIESPRSR